VAFDPERRLFGLTMRWVLIAAAAIVLVLIAVWVLVVAV
jgi:hypothetical protein